MNKMILSLLLIGISVHTNANFSGDPSSIEYKEANGLKIQQYNGCYVNYQSSVDLCSDKITNGIKKHLSHKINFGDNSILMKTWDSKLNYWVYFAVNPTTKKVHPYYSGVRAYSGNPKTPKITKDNSMLCTSGTNVSFIGDGQSQSLLDDDALADYCVDYYDEYGFDLHHSIDPKTKKIIDTFAL